MKRESRRRRRGLREARLSSLDINWNDGLGMFLGMLADWLDDGLLRQPTVERGAYALRLGNL